MSFRIRLFKRIVVVDGGDKYLSFQRIGIGNLGMDTIGKSTIALVAQIGFQYHIS